jgi:transcriptional regulator with PAS, ATPase and Fis domain
MRADFFHRLNVLRLDVPPLRERLDDLRLLVRQLLGEDPLARQRGITDVTDPILAQLRTHRWPGNVRELRNTLRRSVALATHGGPLGQLDLDLERTVAPESDTGAERWTPFRAWMRAREHDYLADLLRRFKTTSEQAMASGLPHRTLYRKLRSHRLSSGRACGDPRAALARTASIHSAIEPLASP